MTSATYTAKQIKAMAREMYELSDDGNIAAQEAAKVLGRAAKTTKALEMGLPSNMQGAAKREITTAIEMYEAAKTFVTPEWQDGKPPYAFWDKDTKTFTVRHF